MFRDLDMNTSEEKSVGCHLTRGIPGPMGFSLGTNSGAVQQIHKQIYLPKKHIIVVSAVCNIIIYTGKGIIWCNYHVK